MKLGEEYGSGASTWLSNNNGTNNANTYSGLLRSYSGSVFSYYGYSINNNNGDALYSKAWASRAVVVVGSGLLYESKRLLKSEGKYLRIFSSIKYKRNIIPSNYGKKSKINIVQVI